jgi:hypothetical protein
VTIIDSTFIFVYIRTGSVASPYYDSMASSHHVRSSSRVTMDTL